VGRILTAPFLALDDALMNAITARIAAASKSPGSTAMTAKTTKIGTLIKPCHADLMNLSS
jgi:hypothetical protein